jgi:hypothetical protein
MGPTDVEKAAETGQLNMKLNVGTPDSNGVFIPSGGKTGQFMDLTWGPDEHLTISATAECESVIAVWAARSISP